MENVGKIKIKYCFVDYPVSDVGNYHIIEVYDEDRILTLQRLREFIKKIDKIELDESTIIKFNVNREWRVFEETLELNYDDILFDVIEGFLIITNYKKKEDQLVNRITESVRQSLLDIFHPEMINAPELLMNITQSSVANKLSNDLCGKSIDSDYNNESIVDLLVLYSNPLVDKSKTNPRYYDRLVLDIDKEIDSILEGVSNYNLKVKLMVADKSQLEELYQPTILHISCHGINTNLLTGECYLCFEDKGEMIEYKSSDLKNFLNINENEEFIEKRRTKLAVIAACHSEYAGKILLECGILNVVCINSLSQLLDDAANIFAKQFYKFLSSGHSINKAFEFAKRQITLKMPKEKLYPCCCSHQHKPKCIFKQKYNECDYHLKHCNCKEFQYHLHSKNCDFGKKLAEKFKSLQNPNSEYINACCCMEEEIPHDESQKFILLHKDNEKQHGEISFHFKRNEKQKVNIVGKNYKIITDICLNYFPYLKGRCELVNKIFEKVSDSHKSSFKNKQRLITLYGNYGIGKGIVASLVARYAWERGYLNNGVDSIKRYSYHNKQQLEDLIYDKLVPNFGSNLRRESSSVDLKKLYSNYNNTEESQIIKEEFMFIIQYDNNAIDKNEFSKLMISIIESSISIWIILIAKSPLNLPEYEIAYEVKELPLEYSFYYFSMKLNKENEKLLNSENQIFKEIVKICGGNIKRIIKASNMLNEGKQLPDILSQLKDLSKYNSSDEKESIIKLYQQQIKEFEYKRKFFFLLSIVPFGISDPAIMEMSKKFSEEIDYNFKNYLTEIKYITIYEPTQVGLIKQDKIIIPFKSKDHFFSTLNEAYSAKDEKIHVLEQLLRYFKRFLRKICYKINKVPVIYEFSPFLNGGIWKSLKSKKSINPSKKSKGILDDPDFMKIEPKDFLMIEKNIFFVVSNLKHIIGDYYHLTEKMLNYIEDISITVPAIIVYLNSCGLVSQHELNNRTSDFEDIQKNLKNILGELTKTDALSRILLYELFSSAGIASIPNLLNEASNALTIEHQLLNHFFWKVSEVDNIGEKFDWKLNLEEVSQRIQYLKGILEELKRNYDPEEYLYLFSSSRVKYMICDLIRVHGGDSFNKSNKGYLEFMNLLIESFNNFKKIKSEPLSFFCAKLLIENLDFTDKESRDKCEREVIKNDLKDNAISKQWATLKEYFKEKLDELNQNIINIFYSRPLLQEVKNLKINEFKTEVEYLKFIEEFNNKYPDHFFKPNIIFSFFPSNDIFSNLSNFKKKISIRENILTENNLVSQFCKKGRIAILFSDINHSEKNIRMCFEDEEIGCSKVFSVKDFEKLIAKNKNWKYDIVIFCMPGGNAYADIMKKNINYAIFFDNLEIYNYFQFNFKESYNNVILKFVIMFLNEILGNPNVDSSFSSARMNFLQNVILNDFSVNYPFEISNADLKKFFTPILKKYNEAACAFDEGEIVCRNSYQTLKLIPSFNIRVKNQIFFRKEEVFEFLTKVLYSSKNTEYFFNLYGEKGVGKTTFIQFITNYLNNRIVFNKTKNNIHYVNFARYFKCDFLKEFDKLIKEEFAFQTITDKKFFNPKYKINFVLIIDECDEIINSCKEDLISSLKLLKFKLMNDRRLSPLIIILTRNKLQIADQALSFIYYELEKYKDGKKSATLLFSKIPLPKQMKLNINEFENFVLKRITSDVISKNNLYNPWNIINYAKTKKNIIYNTCISNTTSIQDLAINSLSQSHNVALYENATRFDRRKMQGKPTVPIKELDDDNDESFTATHAESKFVTTNFGVVRNKNKLLAETYMRQKTSKYDKNFVNVLLNTEIQSIKEEDLELNKNLTVISKPSHDTSKPEKLESLEALEIDKFNKFDK